MNVKGGRERQGVLFFSCCSFMNNCEVWKLICDVENLVFCVNKVADVLLLLIELARLRNKMIWKTGRGRKFSAPTYGSFFRSGDVLFVI